MLLLWLDLFGVSFSVDFRYDLFCVELLVGFLLFLCNWGFGFGLGYVICLWFMLYGVGLGCFDGLFSGRRFGVYNKCVCWLLLWFSFLLF